MRRCRGCCRAGLPELHSEDLHGVPYARWRRGNFPLLVVVGPARRESRWSDRAWCEQPLVARRRPAGDPRTIRRYDAEVRKGADGFEHRHSIDVRGPWCGCAGQRGSAGVDACRTVSRSARFTRVVRTSRSATPARHSGHFPGSDHRMPPLRPVGTFCE